MAILTASEIRNKIKNGRIEIDPFTEKQLQVNSYDVLLSDILLEYNTEATNGIIDAARDNPIHQYKIPKSGIVLHPGRLYLGATVERTYAADTVPFLDGKSSVGRLGINIHSTAGKGDIGFNGTWTLEISVVQSVKVYGNMPIGQVYFNTVEGFIIDNYGDTSKNSKYQGQKLPTASRMYLNFNQ